MRNPKALGLSLFILLAFGAGALVPSAGATEFTANSYPTTVTATSALGNDVFTVDGSSVECAVHFEGALSEASTTITITPTYTSCKAFGFASATVNMNGCDYRFYSNGEVDVECPVGKVITIVAGNCEVQVGAQKGLKSVALSNSGSHVNAKANLTGITVNATKDGFLCPLSGTGHKSSTYVQGSAITVKPVSGGTSIDLGTGATSTSVTTSLSGEGKSGEAITVNEGAKVKDQATLSGTNAFKATGTVEYKVFADSECKELVTTAGKVTVTGGSVPASSEVELTAGAVYYWQAVYSGDASNLGSSSVCGKEVLTVKAATSLTTSLTGGGEAAPEIEVEEEVGVTDKATLSGTNVSKAGGTVKYSVYSDAECKELVTSAGEKTVTSGSVPSSNEVKLPGGFYYWQAVYSGDATHLGSTGVCGSEIQIVTEPTSLTTSLWSEGESGEEIEVPEGTLVYDTATLSGANASEATGTVEYRVYADEECEELVAEAGAVAVSEGEIPASEAVQLPAGTYYWQATYFGDPINRRSTSACGLEVLNVEADPLTTSLSGGSQSGARIEVPEKTPVTDKATLNMANAETATGTVEYNVYADSECEELVAEAGKVTVVAGTIPSSSEVTLPAGVYYWQASYSGDLTHPATVSVCGIEVLVVAAPTSLTTSLSGEGESGKEIEVQEGAGVSDSATLSGANASKATGVAQYKVYADSECKELVASAGSVEVSGGTIPESEEMFLPAGTYYWQVTYFGDALNQSSTSACDEVLQVNTASLTLQLTGDEEKGPEIEVPEETPVIGDATLNIENAGTATGYVEYKVYADSECKELVNPAGKVTVSAGVIPPSTEQTLPEGTYYWQATYLGDETHPSATSICGKAVQQVKATWIVSVGDSYISGEGGRWAGNVGNNNEWKAIDAHGPNAYKNPENGEAAGEAIELCHRSTAAEIFIKIPAVKSKNLACSGAKVESFSTGTWVVYNPITKNSTVVKKGTFTPGLDFKSVKETAEINPGKGRCGLPECKGQALLLQEFAEARKKNKESIKMVVVSISGNDFGFAELIKACVLAYRFGGECSKQAQQIARFEKANLEAKQKLIEKGLNNVGSAMEKAGFKKADYTILVQDYMSPIPEAALKFRYTQNEKPKFGTYRRIDPGGCPFKDADAAWANTTGLKKINETVKKAYEEVDKAAKYALKFMELETAFNGRRLCETGTSLVGKGTKFPNWEAPGAVDETEWINQIRIATLGTQFYQQESLHPNYWGQLALRNCVRRAYNNGAPKGGTCVIEGKGLFAPPGAPKPGVVPPGKKRPWDWEPKMELKP